MSPTVGWLRDRPHGDRLGLCYLFVTPLNRPDKRGWKQRMQLLLATFSCLPQMVEMVGARGFHSARSPVWLGYCGNREWHVRLFAWACSPLIIPILLFILFMLRTPRFLSRWGHSAG